MNNQKPEPRVKGNGELLDFHSMFFTIQGEGPFTGHRAVFIRLAGCNLQCPGCDTEYTQGREKWYARRIAIEADHLARRNNADQCLIVVTGGEPLRQSIGILVAKLFELGHPVQIESNGVFAPDHDLDHMLTHWSYSIKLIVSPKTTRVSARSAELASAFKYVLDHRSMSETDGLPIKALDHPASTGVARPPEGKTVYLNPFDSGDPEVNRVNLLAVAHSAKRYGYIAGVQLHKLMELE